MNSDEIHCSYMGFLRGLVDSLIPGLSHVFLIHLDVVLTLACSERSELSDTSIHY